MKKLILCIFSLCVITLFSPIKAYALGVLYAPQTAPSTYIAPSASAISAFEQQCLTYWSNTWPTYSYTGYVISSRLDDTSVLCLDFVDDASSIDASQDRLATRFHARASGDSITDFQYKGYLNNTVPDYLGNNVDMVVLKVVGVTLTYNGTTVNPSTPAPSSPDGFFLSKDGTSFIFGTFCTENSAYFDAEGSSKPPFYYTQDYTFRISVDGFDHYEVPSLQYWRYLTSVPQIEKPIDFISTPYVYYASAIYSEKARALKCFVGTESEGAVTSYPLTDCRSVNRISLRQLAAALNADQLSDVCTEITVSAQNSIGDTVWTDTIDFTTLSPSSIPSIDPSEPDQTTAPDVLNQWMYSQQNLLNELIKGQPYDKPPLNTSIGDYSINDLHAIASPDVTLEQVPLDSRPLGWFATFVEWWYSSPFGLIALASLTFLIIRTIIW